MTTPASRSTLVRPDGGPRRTDRGHWPRLVSEPFLIQQTRSTCTCTKQSSLAKPGSTRTHPDRDRRTIIGLLGTHERRLSPHVNRPRTSGTDAEPTKGTHHVQF